MAWMNVYGKFFCGKPLRHDKLVSYPFIQVIRTFAVHQFVLTNLSCRIGSHKTISGKPVTEKPICWLQSHAGLSHEVFRACKHFVWLVHSKEDFSSTQAFHWRIPCLSWRTNSQPIDSLSDVKIDPSLTWLGSLKLTWLTKFTDNLR